MKTKTAHGGNEAFEIVKWNRHVSDTGILRGHCADTYPVDGVNFH